MSAGKAWSLPKSVFLTYLQIIRLGYKGLLGTNNLAYLIHSSIKAKTTRVLKLDIGGKGKLTNK
jgi:hypothetical protein